MRSYLNDQWEYFSRWTDSIFVRDGGQQVRLPHTNAQTPFNCFDESIYQFVSGYKRNLYLDKVEGTYILTFEAVAHCSEVFVNGRSVAQHNCGYTAFSADVTEHLVAGNNQIVVKVDSRETSNVPPFGNVIDYLTYGGIYREVYLDRYVGSYIADAFVVAEPSEPLKVSLEIGNFKAPARISMDVLDGEQVIKHLNYVADNYKYNISQNLDLQLWDIANPKLYTLKLTVDNNVWQTNFGVRSAKFTKDGFYLNGKKLKLVGLNRHQCFPYVGYAMPESMQRRDAQILKQKLGVNIVRTSHYPQSHYFLDECDKLGLLVFTEIPGWQHIGDGAWQAVAMHNVEEMVLQYRNHPSIIMWGVRINESLDSEWLYKKTNALCHRLDPTRPTGGVRYLAHSQFLEDVYTFNDFNRNGATDRKEVCETEYPYLVTEYNGHMFPTKSYDDFPHRREHMLRYARMLDGVFAAKDTCGAIGWCMFDYNTHKDFGSGDRVCYHGVLDMFRNPKMASGIFAAMGEKDFFDVCFTTDIGDYPEGVVGDIYCLTNADKVELYKGNTLVKTYTHANSPFKNMPKPPILIDDLIGNRMTVEDGIDPKYAEMIKVVIADIQKNGVNNISAKNKVQVAKIMLGTKLNMEQLVQLYKKYTGNWGSATSNMVLKAYRNGRLIANKTVGSANSVQLEITVSHKTLHENTTYDVAAVNVRALDQNGNLLPYISKVVHFRAEGAIEIIGDTVVPLMGGSTGTFVRTTGEKGRGKLWIDDQFVDFEIK